MYKSNAIQNWEILCAEVKQSYGVKQVKVPVLDGISLTVKSGEITTILGPSGCGKSTLMRLIAGYEYPQAGYIAFPTNQARCSRMINTFLAQDDQLLLFRTLLQNALLPAEIARTLSSTTIERAKALLSRIGLAGFFYALPDELSGGMRQRGLMAMHLLLDRQLYIFDEPFAALDIQAVEVMSGVLREIRDQNGAAFLLVLHDVIAAAALSDVIYVLSPRPARLVKAHRPSVNLVGLAPSSRKQHPEFDTLVLDILHSIENSTADSASAADLRP
jgi:NitT/TauT family transport system ATP-binding protein